MAGDAAALTVDVAVVGAGPAGASAAIACAEVGLRVAVCELRRFPRDRVGETLHPGAEAVFERLGVLERVSEAGFPRHAGIWVGSQDGQRFDPYGEDAGGPWRGFQAWRAQLDSILLERARELGARVLQPCRALAPRVSDGRVTGLRTTAGDIAAGFVVDAGGPQQWLARRLGLAIRRRSPRLVARYGYLAGSRPVRDLAPAFLSDDAGWTWSARVRPGLYQWTRLNLAGPAPVIDGVPADLRGLESLRTAGADVSWRALCAPAGQGYFAVGDAAAVLDPAASHGVLRALLSGLLAGRLIAACLDSGQRHGNSPDHYRAWLSDWVEHDVRRLSELYGAFPEPPAWLADCPLRGSPVA